MVTITSAELHVEPVTGVAGDRRLVVAYTIRVPEGDPMIGTSLVEEAVVHARDVGGTPVAPTELEVRMEGAFAVEAGEHGRALTTDVHRVDLDVERDWWRTDHAGGIEPIAEFVDHIVADVWLRSGDAVVATTTTPTLTGSWGALGDD
jgi:hypothetical protein